MRDTFLAFSPPSLGQEEIDEVIDTLRSDWITTGPKVKRFEQEFAQFIGAPAALALSSATDAMQVALAALGIGPGDEVITTPMTFCSTVHVIEHVGARPVLVDVAPDTLTIDPAQVERAVTAHTKAILPVHLYGHPCAMDELLDIAQRHQLAVVEDAAHALPTKYKGRLVGGAPPAHDAGEGEGVRVLTAFSFYATKNMTTGEGGMLTGDTELIDQARLWSLHGMSRDAYKRYSAEGSWYYEVVLPGYKCNMTDIQAALGLQQLKKLPCFQQRRREIVARYQAAFRALAELEPPTERAGMESAWQLYILRLNLDRLTIDRARFIEELKARYIGTSVHFIPVHVHPYYRDKYGYQPLDYPVAYQEYGRIVSLPLHPRLSDEDVMDVIEAVTDVVEKYRKG
ncbi:UDP-4-amino-4-deoxy-L-arabinose-oxoglutarate aminotransferase [Planctomycetaceae bacterium]|nr:UDP-4-amino-4-deoxy-L-arabinose-oxoglutarate aminotransferase [Planctomycetaceae bacterium]